LTYADLIAWSERLPSWQRDALRRVLTRERLSENDVDEIAALARAQRL
jgi:hypothetical protein